MMDTRARPYSSEKSVRILDVATNRLIAVGTEHSDFVYSVAFSPDGKRLLYWP